MQAYVMSSSRMENDMNKREVKQIQKMQAIGSNEARVKEEAKSRISLKTKRMLKEVMVRAGYQSLL
jgi:hypothetical protein